MQKYIDKFKKSSSPEPLGQFQPNLAQVSLDEEDSSLFKWRAHSFPRGDNYEITKIHYKFEKSSSPGPLGQFQPNLPQNIRRWNLLLCTDGNNHIIEIIGYL